MARISVDHGTSRIVKMSAVPAMAAAHHAGGGTKFPMILRDIDTGDHGRLKKPTMSVRMAKR